jgi:hypothetical protein
MPGLMAKLAFQESLFGPDNAWKWVRPVAGTEYALRIVLPIRMNGKTNQTAAALQVIHTGSTSANTGGTLVLSEMFSYADTAGMVEGIQEQVRRYWPYVKDRNNFCPTCGKLRPPQSGRIISDKYACRCALPGGTPA